MRPDKALLAAIHPAELRLPVEGSLPSFDGATEWINSSPLTPGGLRGKVVLVQFWTYTCINWLRTLAYVRAWATRYKDQGLVVIGAHTPEFTFEHDIDNVRKAVRDMAIDYPVAVDSDFAIWRAFDNHYWPALYFADAQGRLRHHRFGEGEFEQSEMVIQQLLAEAGFADLGDDVVSIDPQGFEIAADWSNLESGENYVGYERTDGFASPEGIAPDERGVYTAPPQLRRNQWALSGDWTIAGEFAQLNERDGGITYRFHGRDLHLVMGPEVKGGSIPFRVLLDGQPPGPDHGEDIDRDGYGAATDQRLYQLVRRRGPIGDRTFEISFVDPGVRAYVFTFG
ncbi:MAG TPA: thioredoxin family protein [Actinomycetota bacterium]|nr:thioredoxin family protein [Actinomycetota bacterium]